MSTIPRVFDQQLWNLAEYTLFLVMGFISLVDEIQFMLISSRHICIRYVPGNKMRISYQLDEQSKWPRFYSLQGEMGREGEAGEQGPSGNPVGLHTH